MARKPATAPAAPAVENDAPALTFTEAGVPEYTRPLAPNPFKGACERIADTLDTDEPGARSTLALAVPVAGDEQAKQYKRHLATMGKTLNVTFRSIVEDGKLTFFAVPRIEHKDRKNA